MTNKDYCKRWREAIRLDPKRAALQREKDIKRNRRNRRRPKTEEEKARINELARLRVAKSRQANDNSENMRGNFCTVYY